MQNKKVQRCSDLFSRLVSLIFLSNGKIIPSSVSDDCLDSIKKRGDYIKEKERTNINKHQCISLRKFIKAALFFKPPGMAYPLTKEKRKEK